MIGAITHLSRLHTIETMWYYIGCFAIIIALYYCQHTNDKSDPARSELTR